MGTLPDPIVYVQGTLLAAPLIAVAVGIMLYSEKRRGESLEVAFRRSHWGLTGGGEGTYFFDADFFLGAPENVARLIEWFPAVLRKIRREVGPISWLGFIEKDSGPVGMLTAKDLLTAKTGVPSVTVRLQRRVAACAVKIPKGTAEQDKSMVLISDVLTTSRTLRRSVERAQRSGFDVRYAVVLYDREEGGREMLREMGIPVLSMLNATELEESKRREEARETKSVVRA